MVAIIKAVELNYSNNLEYKFNKDQIQRTSANETTWMHLHIIHVRR